MHCQKRVRSDQEIVIDQFSCRRSLASFKEILRAAFWSVLHFLKVAKTKTMIPSEGAREMKCHLILTVLSVDMETFMPKKPSRNVNCMQMKVMQLRRHKD